MFYSNWNTGEPNNAGGDEDCVHTLQNTHKWNDLRCTFSYSYICQKPQGKSIKVQTDYACINFLGTSIQVSANMATKQHNSIYEISKSFKNAKQLNSSEILFIWLLHMQPLKFVPFGIK